MERDVEARIKAALVAAGFQTEDIDGNAKDVVFRAWMTDDAPSEDKKIQDFPCVVIKASTAANTGGYQSHFWDVPVMVRCMSHIVHDPKRTRLVALYEDVREVLEYTALSGFTVVGSGQLLIEESGETNNEENIQFMDINAVVKCCGVAS